MRIPLDYYRILGLPIQSTEAALTQAYRDRALQLPRREYSESAIAARKQLLDEAYAVLSNPEQRAAYDASFLAKGYEQLSPQSDRGTNGNNPEAADPYTPSIEIKADQLVGALLILQELGEYELVLQQGHPYLTSLDSISLDKGKLGAPQLVRPDIVLTLAIACLELGREQWQQAHYENAANSLETGQELLLKEGLFASLRGEIQSDLFKLRPYRILELLALPEDQAIARHKGLRLLQEMLQERGGIDGTGDDQSGLSIDDFLRFIQQLRTYLSAEEQQNLFESEARRPSAVATYLAVYALLARGFTARQPALVSRAKQMLLRLGRRQDVHLEQAVCALLLGQTEEASRALELSQEYEPLAFIRENSQGAPDLLPGLCLYGERWLQTSVFPHFRDLASLKASLKEYFADAQVQAYLEELPGEAENPQEWAVVEREIASVPVSSRVTRNQGATREAIAPTASGSHRDSATATLTPSSISTLPTADRVSALTSEAPVVGSSLAVDAPSRRQRRPRGGDESLLPLPPGRSKKSGAKPARLLLVALASLVGAGLIGFLLLSTFGWLQRTLQGDNAKLQPNQPSVQIQDPPVAIPEPGSQIVAPDGPINQETAEQVIQTWLTTKSIALGRSHQVDKLDQILVAPALSTWRSRAAKTKGSDAYWEYKHDIKVESVKTNKSDPDSASVQATVKEGAEFYKGGKLDQNASYNDDLRVRYELVRKQGEWRIKNMVVLK